MLRCKVNVEEAYYSAAVLYTPPGTTQAHALSIDRFFGADKDTALMMSR